MEHNNNLTRDGKIKVIKYVWRSGVVRDMTFEDFYDAIIENNKPLFESIVQAGFYSENDRESFNSILTNINSLKYDYGVAIVIDKWKKNQAGCISRAEGDVKSLSQAKITDEILVYLLDNDAIHYLESDKKKFVSLEQLIFFFLDKYGSNLITPENFSLSLTILDESRKILINSIGIQLLDKSEADNVKHEAIICDGGATSRQEVLSNIPEIKNEDDVFIFCRFLFFYKELCSRNTVRYTANKYSNVEDFENNYLIEGTLFEEAHHWKSFAENISEKSFLYKDCSFWGDSTETDLNVFTNKIITDIFHLSNQTMYPEFHNRNIGKSAIEKISELKKLPSEKLKERIEPRNRTLESAEKLLQIMKERDMRSGSEKLNKPINKIAAANRARFKAREKE